MAEPVITGKTAAKEVRSKLSVLNALTTFVVFTLLLVIARSIFEPAARYLSFMPDLSVAVIMIIVLILTLVSVSFSRVFSKQVVTSIESYSRALDSVLNLTREIREETYGDVLLEKIIDHSLDVTDSEAGSIILREDNGLVFKIVRGAGATDLVGKSIPRDSGIAGRVFKKGQPLLMGDAEKGDKLGSVVYDLAEVKARSVLCVPMKAKGKTVGVIELLNKMDGGYTDRDVEMVGYLADHAAISLERARFYEDQRNYEIHLTNIMLDSIDRLVPVKRGHSKRVARYSAIMAKSIKMPDERARRLYFACLLHDIGFVRIPLDKFGEKTLLKQHSKIGYEMLAPINFYSDIASFVLHHHERFDGKGYPAGLTGTKIPLESRIISIAEAFDAMVSAKSYKKPLGFDEALEELRVNAGTQFDPTLVEHFVNSVTRAAID